ncbi:MAG: amidohydrolase [Chloroflexi bacterium]|nr:MAG: amidohydrolase [Chloroflexota bacterium]
MGCGNSDWTPPSSKRPRCAGVPRIPEELHRVRQRRPVEGRPGCRRARPHRRDGLEKHWPLYERCQELGLIVLFHTGTSGIGAGQPGGQGIRIDFARPIWLDAPAAAFPDLKIIAAHFGYPWHLELLAMALHKTNINIDISGWAPRYIPTEVMRDMKGRLQDQFVFGSDYPFIQPQRCLDELQGLDIPELVLEKVLVGNGRRLLGIA